jgi:hypothetical protein
LGGSGLKGAIDCAAAMTGDISAPAKVIARNPLSVQLRSMLSPKDAAYVDGFFFVALMPCAHALRLCLQNRIFINGNRQ